MRAAIVAALRGEQRAGRGVLVVAQDPAGDRLALDPFHHEARAEPSSGSSRNQTGGTATPAVGRGLERELGRAVRLPGRGPGIAAEHERMAGAAGGDRVEGPRLARRAAREPAQVFDRHRCPRWRPTAAASG